MRILCVSDLQRCISFAVFDEENVYEEGCYELTDHLYPEQHLCIAEGESEQVELCVGENTYEESTGHDSKECSYVEHQSVEGNVVGTVGVGHIDVHQVCVCHVTAYSEKVLGQAHGGKHPHVVIAVYK